MDSVEALHSAIGQGAADEATGLVRSDVRWNPGAFWTGRPSYRGREGVRLWLDSLASLACRGERAVIAWGELRRVYGHVVAGGRGRIVRAAGDLTVDFAHLYALDEDGLVARLDRFPSVGEAELRALRGEPAAR